MSKKEKLQSDIFYLSNEIVHLANEKKIKSSDIIDAMVMLGKAKDILTIKK